MKTITREALLQRLLDQSGTTFAGLTTITEPGKGLTKISRVHVILNASYARAMAKRTDDPEFRAKPRTWGFRIGKSPVIRHRDSYYLEARIEASLGHEYRENGHIVSEEYAKAKLPKRSEHPVILRDYKLESIVEITIDGENYHVCP